MQPRGHDRKLPRDVRERTCPSFGETTTGRPAPGIGYTHDRRRCFLRRGPRSARALDAAMPVAHRRGEVMFFEQRTGSCFDFMTPGPAGPAAIRVERALRIHGSLAGIARDYADTIDRMNAAVLPPGFSRELWLWAPWGTMRFFRIESATITELDMLGSLRAPLVKGALAGKKRPRWRKSRKKTGLPMQPTAAVPEEPLTAGENGPAPGMVPAATTGTPSPAPGTPAPTAGIVREPAPIRYLRHRAAEMRRAKEAEPGAHPPTGPAAGAHGNALPGGDDRSPS